MLPLILALLGAEAIWACSCSDRVYRPACEAFLEPGAVFVGTVVSRNGPERLPSYSVYVEEIFRGIPRNTRLVHIESELMCGMHFELGKQYLIFAAARHGWPGLYAAGMCSGTREVAHAAEDMAWLHAQARKQQTTKVYGTVLQNRDWRAQRPLEDGDVRLAGANISLEGESRAYYTVASANGEFSIKGVRPGKYLISAQKPPWISSPYAEVRVREGGCARRNLVLQSGGMIKGRLLDASGKPASGVDVVQVLADGRMAGAESLHAETDREGRFVLAPVAAGDFVLGVSLRSAPQSRKPYAPVFYPGVRSFADAQRFRLAPHEQVSGLTMRLPPPIPRREVTVRVFWADGRPVKQGARAGAMHRGRTAAFEQARFGNVVTLRLLEGLDYEIDADWFNGNAWRVYWMDSEPVRLTAGKGPADVSVRLRWVEPSRH